MFSIPTLIKLGMNRFIEEMLEPTRKENASLSSLTNANGRVLGSMVNAVPLAGASMDVHTKFCKGALRGCASCVA